MTNIINNSKSSNYYNKLEKENKGKFS